MSDELDQSTAPLKDDAPKFGRLLLVLLLAVMLIGVLTFVAEACYS